LQNLHFNLDSLNWINSNHEGIFKKVCFGSDEFISNITQVAYTELMKGAEVSTHVHPSMEEVFFLIEGVCEFKIQEIIIVAERQSITRIPSNKNHSLRAISDCKFFYFGVSI
jgi:mannose-6-phosphate isomerase-like protein (cupin superfamily)